MFRRSHQSPWYNKYSKRMMIYKDRTSTDIGETDESSFSIVQEVLQDPTFQALQSERNNIR